MLSTEDILKLSRSQVRYYLYRIRTAEENGIEDKETNIKEFYQKQKGFTNWKEFARIWDIDEEGKHYRIIRRSMTEEEEWTSQLKLLARELPND